MMKIDHLLKSFRNEEEINIFQFQRVTMMKLMWNTWLLFVIQRLKVTNRCTLRCLTCVCGLTLNFLSFLFWKTYFSFFLNPPTFDFHINFESCISTYLSQLQIIPTVLNTLISIFPFAHLYSKMYSCVLKQF